MKTIAVRSGNGTRNCGQRLVAFTVELKANNVVKSNQDLTISWLGIGKQGAMGIYFGLTKRFGK